MGFEVIWQQLSDSYRHLQDSVGFFCVKDLSGHFCYFNDQMMKYAGYSCPSELLGKTDFDTSWAGQAPHIRKNDRLVMSTRRPFQFYESFQNQDGEYELYVSHKKPFFRDEILTGVLSSSIAAPAESVVGALPFSEDLRFFDIKRRAELALTARQKETLYWLLCGYSTREIARIIKLSRRTIEHYLNTIKEVNKYHYVREILLNVRAV